jgi:hypothetical protein
VVNDTPRPLYLWERPGTHCIGGWVGLGAGLDRYGKSRPPPGFNPQTIPPIASRYAVILVQAQGLCSWNRQENVLFLTVCTLPLTLTHTTRLSKHAHMHTHTHTLILENATCLCNKGDQTIDHLINQCTLRQMHRELLRNNILKSRKWPVSKEQLIMKHMKSFLIFTKSVDFDQM